MSDFGGLFVGLSGLTAQRYALEVTGQNMANASTAGYHDQSVTMSAVGQSVVPAFYSTGQQTGSGVQVTGVARDYDQFLQQRVDQEHASNSMLSSKQRTLSQIESVVGEPSSTGLQSQMSKLWTSFQSVAQNPSGATSASVRATLIQQANTVASGFNQLAGSFDALWTSSQQALATTAQTATVAAQQIATLNGQILNARNAGDSPNSLLDQRDALVTKLSEQLGVTTTNNTNGTINVNVGGAALVQGVTSLSLTVTGPTSMAGVPVGGSTSAVQLAVSTSSGTSPLTNVGGSAGALLDAVDTTIPSYRDQLDTVASTIASKVNTQLQAGYDQNGNPGVALFTGTTAATLAVAISNPSQIAAAANAPTAGVPSSDGTNALDVSQLSLKTGSSDSVYASMIGNLGVASQAATNRAKTQASITTQADADQQSATGVDIDTESTKLIQYQTAYQASAKYISTVNTTLQDLLNMVS